MAPKQTLGALGTRDGLIRYFEASNKVRLNAYLDSEGIPTIGWGATSYSDGRPVRMGDTVTATQAEELFKFHVDRSVAALRSLPSWAKYNENQRQALESFAYNAGPNFLQSKNFKTISAAIRNGDVQGVIKALPMYTNGKTPGLVKRRAAEINLFKAPVDPPKVTAQPAKQKGQPAVAPNFVEKLMRGLGIKKNSFNMEKLQSNMGSIAAGGDAGFAIFASTKFAKGNAKKAWNKLPQANRKAWQTVGGELGIQAFKTNPDTFKLPASINPTTSQYKNPSDLSVSGVKPGDLGYGVTGTHRGLEGLPGLNEIAQAGIANYGAFKDKSNLYGKTAFDSSRSGRWSNINQRSYGSNINLGGSLGINTAATSAAGTRYGGAAMSMNTSAINSAAWGGK